MDEIDTYSCRVCLRNEICTKKYLSLFDNYEDISVSEHITSIANVEIQEGDGLPDRICPECLLQLDNALAFKRKCESSDKLLRGIELREIPIEYKDADEMSVKDETETEVDYESDNSSTKVDIVKKNNRTKNVQFRNRNFECDECNASFKSKSTLLNHIKKSHSSEKLICPICKAIFSTTKRFNKHIKYKTAHCNTASEVDVEGEGKSRTFHCKQCSHKCNDLKAMTFHQTIHNGEKNYECKTCHKKFAHPSTLHCHQDTHTASKVQRTCHICGVVTTGRRNIYHHAETHHSRRFKCKLCDKAFIRRDHLADHMKRHSGIKLYLCEMCPAKFATLPAQINHRNITHLKKNKEKYKCDICAYGASTLDALRKHKAKHNGTNIPCLICGRFLDNPSKYARHKKLHEDRQYRCPICSKMYSTSTLRNKHVQRTHKTKTNEGIKEEKKFIEIEVIDGMENLENNTKKITENLILSSNI